MSWFNGSKKEKWFYDKYGEVYGLRVGLEIDKQLYHKKNKFQLVQIFETKHWGRILTLDETIQTTERDGFIYHEMISHVPLFLHQDPKDILIIGGGDGGVLKEVLKHKIKKATLVEIDNDVIEASKKYLTKIHRNAFFDKRVEIIVDDGIEFIKKFKNTFDVIIVDSTDPVGVAEALFSEKFYNDAKGALKKNGILVTQSGFIFVQAKGFKKTYKKFSKIFRHYAIYLIAIPTYPSSLLTFMIGSETIDFDKQSFLIIKNKYNLIKNHLKFYNPEIHQAAFMLPEFIKKNLTR